MRGVRWALTFPPRQNSASQSKCTELLVSAAAVTAARRERRGKEGREGGRTDRQTASVRESGPEEEAARKDVRVT